MTQTHPILVDTFDYEIEKIAQEKNITIERALQIPFEEKFKVIANGSASYISLLHDQYPVYKNETLLVSLVQLIRAYAYKPVTLAECLATDAYRPDNKSSDVAELSVLRCLAHRGSRPLWNDVMIVNDVISMMMMVHDHVRPPC
jgi:hypothetical protein